MIKNEHEFAEAMLIVQKALELGKAQGVEDGLLVGMVSPVGRFVVYTSREDELTQGEGLPIFSEAEQAAVWITTADREDTYVAVELANALSNWMRLATVNTSSEDLFALGSALAQAVSGLAQGNPFDQEDWD